MQTLEEQGQMWDVEKRSIKLWTESGGMYLFILGTSMWETKKIVGVFFFELIDTFLLKKHLLFPKKSGLLKCQVFPANQAFAQAANISKDMCTQSS